MLDTAWREVPAAVAGRTPPPGVTGCRGPSQMRSRMGRARPYSCGEASHRRRNAARSAATRPPQTPCWGPCSACAGSDGAAHLIRLAAAGVHAEAERARTAAVRYRGKEVASAVATARELISQARGAARAGIGELAVTSAEIATAEADWAWLRPGESDEVARWRDAVGRWDALCFPYPAAHARWRLSHALLSRSGSSAEASQELRSALAAADALGAKALTQQILELGTRAWVDLEPVPSDEPFRTRQDLTSPLAAPLPYGERSLSPIRVSR